MAESFDNSPDTIELKGKPTGITRISKKAKLLLGILLLLLVIVIIVSSYQGMTFNQQKTPEEELDAKKNEQETQKAVTTANFDKEGIPDAQSSTIPLDEPPASTPLPGQLPGQPVSLGQLKGGTPASPGGKPATGSLDPHHPLDSKNGDRTPGTSVPPLGGGMGEGGPGESAEASRVRERQRKLDQNREQAVNSGLDAPGEWVSSKANAAAATGAAGTTGVGTLFGGDGAGAGAAARPGMATPGALSPDDQNKQIRKESFIKDAASQRDDLYLREVKHPAISKYQLNIGWKIPAGLECGINSDLPGTVCGLVRENVCDSATGKYLLIPQGTKVHGTYDSQVAVGQERILAVWNYLEFQDGSIQSLKGMLGADQAGYAGFDADVDNHYWKLFGMTGMMSLFSAGFQLSQPQTSQGSNGVPSTSQAIAASVGQQLGQTGTAIAQKQLNVQPTLKRNAGYRFNVMVTRNLVFEKSYGRCY